MKKDLKLFVIRKYILAESAAQALRKDKDHLPDDCWLDEDYRRMKTQDKAPSVGFKRKHK